VLQCGVVRFSVLQCVAVCYSVLQCVAVFMHYGLHYVPAEQFPVLRILI